MAPLHARLRCATPGAVTVARFIIRRAVAAIPVLLGITLLTVALIHLVPGDPARLLLGLHATPAAIAHMRRTLGLDESLPAQYWHIITFHFGTSVSYQEPVMKIVTPRIAPSLLLIAFSMVLAVLLAVPLALLSAVHRGGRIDAAVKLLTTTTLAMPSFWTGLLLILICGVSLHLLPTSGYGSGFAGHLESLCLPAFTIALYIGPILLRTLRASAIEALDSEYVEAARARGLRETRIIFKHVLRNSLIGMVTLLGIAASVLVSATVVVENVFAIPGLGTLLVSSVSSRDFPVVEALTLIFGITVVVVGIVTDVIYRVVDPRVRL